MARKTTTKTSSRAKPDTTGKPRRTKAGEILAIDDNFKPKTAPKAKEKAVTLAEALAEAGQTIEELVADNTVPPAADRPTREAGMSNLATTIRAHRKGYTTVLHPNGKKTQNNGDTVAQALLFARLDELKAFSAGAFGGKTYDSLNPGHARMCIGNLIRGAVRKDDHPANAAAVEFVAKLVERATKGGEEPESDLDNDEQGAWNDTSAE